MPPCPSDNTAGTWATGVLAPCWVTSQIGPTFSVTSMRPSGRKAIRQGRLKLATWAMAKGVEASGAWVPILTWAWAALAASTADAAQMANFIFVLACVWWRPGAAARLGRRVRIVDNHCRAARPSGRQDIPDKPGIDLVAETPGQMDQAMVGVADHRVLGRAIQPVQRRLVHGA